MLVPVWIDGLLRRTCSEPVAKKIKGVWDGLVDQFLEIDFVRKHHNILHLFDDVTKLEWGLKFTRGFSMAFLSGLMIWVKKRLSLKEDKFYPNAFTEQEFNNRDAQYIVYGHTHIHEIVPLIQQWALVGHRWSKCTSTQALGGPCTSRRNSTLPAGICRIPCYDLSGFLYLR